MASAVALQATGRLKSGASDGFGRGMTDADAGGDGLPLSSRGRTEPATPSGNRME